MGVVNENYTIGTIYIRPKIFLLAEKSPEELIATMDSKQWWRDVFIPELEKKNK